MAKLPYRVQVFRKRKLVERNHFLTEEQAYKHYDFLERRYYHELEDFNVRISIVYNGIYLKAA